MTSLPPQPLSPLDGRYRAAVGELGEHLSEAGLNRARVQVEVDSSAPRRSRPSRRPSCGRS